jgi:hypothetical protein
MEKKYLNTSLILNINQSKCLYNFSYINQFSSNCAQLILYITQFIFNCTDTIIKELYDSNNTIIKDLYGSNNTIIKDDIDINKDLYGSNTTSKNNILNYLLPLMLLWPFIILCGIYICIHGYDYLKKIYLYIKKNIYFCYTGCWLYLKNIFKCLVISYDSDDIDLEQVNYYNNNTFNSECYNFVLPENTTNIEICTICIDNLFNDDNIAKILKLDCEHKFHTECLHPWIQQAIENNKDIKCPLCREKINITINKMDSDYD